jgi:hypothetical protein
VLAKMLRWVSGRRPRSSQPAQVVVYTRQGCDLCDQAIDLLRKYEGQGTLTIQECDIDQDPNLVARFGDKVPAVEIDGKLRFLGKVNEVLLRRLIATSNEG